ncbi:MAG: Crp/Fnr family transcriptional regulator [Flammeovirgaceae bacterium]
MEELISFIQQTNNTSREAAKLIVENFEPEVIPKKSIILKEHQYCRKLYFIKKGLVRTFYYFQGNDVSSWFYSEGYFFTAWFSFYSQKPSIENIQALENTEVLSINYTAYQKLLNQHPSIEHFGRKLAEGQLAFIDEYSKGYMFLSAQDRYRMLIEYFPDIELRVKISDIASFLGITRETLSRIRAKK